MAQYEIYYLICPIDKKVRYVGKSTKAKQRFKDHIKDFGETTGKKQWILKLKNKGLVPILKIIQETDNEEKARELEHLHVIRNISTIYNIFQPAKKTCTVNDFRKQNNTKIDLEFITVSKYDKL